MTSLSVLDLAPITEGSTPRSRSPTRLISRATPSALGYHRYWLAEHHNMPGIASAATAVVIAHVAAGTSTHPRRRRRRHAAQPRAAGHCRAIRHARGAASGPHRPRARPRARHRHDDGARAAPEPRCRRRQFPAGRRRADQLFRSRPNPARRLRAVPGEGQDVEVWILGSSDLSARSSPPCSACPTPSPRISRRPQMSDAIDIYRARFQPSERLAKPTLMLGLNVFAADTDAEARRLFTSLQQAFVNLRTGRAGKLPPPVEDYEDQLDPMAKSMLDQALSCCGRRLARDREERRRRLHPAHRRRRTHGHGADLRPSGATALLRNSCRSAPAIVKGSVRALTRSA